MSAGAADLTLSEPGSIPDDFEERAVLEPKQNRSGKGGWSPSREKVIWHWPDLNDRLVETLE